MANQIGNYAKSQAASAGKRAMKKATDMASGAAKGALSAATGAATGGLSTAAQAAKKLWDNRKNLDKIAAKAALYLTSGTIAVIGTGWTIFAVSIFFTALVIGSFLVIINSGAYIVPPGDLTESAGIDAPENWLSDCPLQGGRLLSQNWGSYNPNLEVGHGSNYYWQNVDAQNGPCSYPNPLRTNCYAPVNEPQNICWQIRPSSQRCGTFGYDADFVSSTSNALYLPKVNGRVLNWTGSFGWHNSDGDSYIYTETSGRYVLFLTHTQSGLATGPNLKSGDFLGYLHIWSRTHLHMEFIMDGTYRKPEDYFCR